jgi:hypothetical protein
MARAANNLARSTLLVRESSARGQLTVDGIAILNNALKRSAVLIRLAREHLSCSEAAERPEVEKYRTPDS